MSGLTGERRGSRLSGSWRESAPMDRFDVRLLLEEMPPAAMTLPRSAASRAAWDAAATITEAEPVDEETLDRERYRGITGADSDESDSEGETLTSIQASGLWPLSPLDPEAREHGHSNVNQSRVLSYLTRVVRAEGEE